MSKTVVSMLTPRDQRINKDEVVTDEAMNRNTMLGSNLGIWTKTSIVLHNLKQPPILNHKPW
jgi:hypothetical protein